MKFLYEYRTRDNAVHSGVVSAANRDAAFAALKAKGIKPSRLTDAPGFFNHLFGRGKRWLAIAVLCALCVAALLAKVGADRRAARTMHDAHATLHVFDSPVRRQPIGDTAEIELGIRTGWSNVFSAEGDRFLASFAIPGAPAAVRSTTAAELRRVLDQKSPSAVHLQPTPTPNSLVARQLIAIVEGMKREINDLLVSGWTLDEVGRALVKRQEREIQCYNLAKSEIDAAWKKEKGGAAALELWQKRNDELRNMGIKTIPLPDRDD